MPTARDVARQVTEPQLELLALLASGYNMTEVAQIKFMHVNTVANRLKAARDRVGASSTTQLVVMCFEVGLIRRNGHGYKPRPLDDRSL